MPVTTIFPLSKALLIRAAIAIFLLVVGNVSVTLALASGARLTAAMSNPLKQSKPNQHKPWRFSKPKKSKWNVRHTKSFRFELKSPISQQSETSSFFDTLPMHKKPRESLSHVLGKGFLWALFKDQYGVPSSS
jgi:hypothetical protein